MTPPDAMSWDEAVRVLGEALVAADNGRVASVYGSTDGINERRLTEQRALAAIQSHRVQAEADARRYRWLRDVAGDDWEVRRDLSDFTSELLYSEHLDTAIDAALAAAANNDGGSK